MNNRPAFKTRGISKALTIVMLLAAVNFLLAEKAPASDGTNAPPVSPRLGVQELLRDPKNYIGKTVELRGFVTDYCKRKGCWALLHDTDPEAKGQIRVKQDESGKSYKPFLAEDQGKTIQVTGEVRGTKIDKDYLDKWEARVRAAGAKTAKKESQEAEEDDSSSTILKQIAGFRERIAKSTNGYLTSISFAVAKWEVSAPTKEPHTSF